MPKVLYIPHRLPNCWPASQHPWSLCMTKSQHTMRGAASQAVTLDDVMPAYHAGSCLSGGHLVEHLGAPQSAPEHPRIPQSAPKRPRAPAPERATAPQNAPTHPERARTPHSVPERPTTLQNAPVRSRAPQKAPERPRSHQSASTPDSAPNRPKRRNAPRPLTLSCLSAITCASFIRCLA